MHSQGMLGNTLVVADKNLPGKGQAGKPAKRENPSKPVQGDSLDELEPNIEDQLTQAKATRVHSETARQKISTKIMDVPSPCTRL